MVDSPLAALSYTTSDGQSEEQSYRIYYQSAHGDVKESKYDGESPGWQDATYVIKFNDLFVDHSDGDSRPLFTDAANNTGLAVVTYMNGTSQQVWRTLYATIGSSVLTRRFSPACSTWIGSISSCKRRGCTLMPQYGQTERLIAAPCRRMAIFPFWRAIPSKTRPIRGTVIEWRPSTQKTSLVDHKPACITTLSPAEPLLSRWCKR